jgi:hypothetical protein
METQARSAKSQQILRKGIFLYARKLEGILCKLLLRKEVTPMTYQERKKKILQLAKEKRVLNPNEACIEVSSSSAHRVGLFAKRLQQEGLITHNQRTGMLEITQQGIDYLDQAS